MIAQNFVNRSLFCDNIKTISNGTKFAYHVTDAHVIDIYVGKEEINIIIEKLLPLLLF